MPISSDQGLLTGWVRFLLPPAHPLGNCVTGAVLGMASFCVSESFSRHPSVVQSLPSNSQGSLEHSLLFSHSVSFSAGHKEAVFRLLSYLEAPNFLYLLSYYKV